MTYQELQNKIRTNAAVSIGDVLSNTFNLFGAVFTNGLLLQVLTVLVLYGLAMLMYIPMMGSIFVIEEESLSSGSSESLTTLSVIMIVGYSLIYIIVAIFQVGLLAAFYNIVRLKDRGLKNQKGANFGMFFKKQYFWKLTLIGVINLVMLGLGSILFVIPLCYLIIPIQFVVLFFAFNPDLSLKELYTLAFSLGTRKWGTTFLTFFISFLIASLGILACGIGFLATASLALLPTYYVYKGVIGFYEDEQAIASIGNHRLLE